VELALSAHATACDTLIWLCLRTAVAIEEHRRRVARHARRLIGSLRSLLRRWLRRRGFAPKARPFGRPAWNRTPPDVEESLVRLHVEHPQLGTGQLMRLAARVLAFRAARETIRKILARRHDLVAALENAQRQRPRRIEVHRPLRLWGADLTLVWLLGFFPVCIFGAVDYHGSHLVSLTRVGRPTSAAVVAALGCAFERHGRPARLLTDRGGAFTAEVTEAFLREHGVEHTLTRPAHPWTNGRIERLFRTFKSTVFAHVWLFASLAQIDRFCADFVVFHNKGRPHSSWGCRTPDEVHFGRAASPPLGRVEYFNGRMKWYRFG
jgi:transposase InsO family protein